jgi:hypothetical protein
VTAPAARTGVSVTRRDLDRVGEQVRGDLKRGYDPRLDVDVG